MKTTIKLIFAAAVVTLFACQKEEASMPSNFPADGVIRVTTNVENPTSRAGITADNIQNFNLKVVNAANASYCYYGFFTKSGALWNCYKDADYSIPLTMLWQNATTPVTVTALSRNVLSFTESYFNVVSKYSVQPDQSSVANLKGSDILYMKPTEIKPVNDLTTDGKLSITFKHLLSKINLSVTLGTELNIAPGTVTNPITGLKIKGTKIAFDWNASANGAFDFSKYLPEGVTPLAGSYTAGVGETTKAVANYEVILVSQTVAANNFSVSFAINGKTYTWISDKAVTLANGNLYTLALTAGKDVVTVSGFTVSEWIPGTGGDVETE